LLNIVEKIVAAGPASASDSVHLLFRQFGELDDLVQGELQPTYIYVRLNMGWLGHDSRWLTCSPVSKIFSTGGNREDL
ncbi:MAG: hypothetical protein ACREX9_07485, partial [Gammaproteobacteria bacterium]